jgi:ubiquinone/menaquinone biosynthesis C-methylase UbiE
LRYVTQAAAERKEGSVIDEGGGESTLVEDLVNEGYGDITILDISATALEVTKRRLGPPGAGVKWIASDVPEVDLPPGAYEIWHDRAVLHFLTGEEQ